MNLSRSIWIMREIIFGVFKIKTAAVSYIGCGKNQYLNSEINVSTDFLYSLSVSGTYSMVFCM